MNEYRNIDSPTIYIESLIEKTEKDGELTEDDAKKATDEVQKIIDRYTKTVDEMVARKEKEIMEV